jgi:hypothetical protein
VPDITKENRYRRTKSYHRQPHTRRANSKMKKIRKRADHPFTISTVPYPLQQRRREKSVQSRHPLQNSSQIKLYRPGTPHSGVPHRKSMTRPAREILTDPAHSK